MKRLISIIITIIALTTVVLPVTASSTIPTFSISEVVKDQTVTIQAINFPTNDSFRVTMGSFGSKGINGVVVTTTNTGSSTSFTATYTIPTTLAGSERIAIRLESPTSGFFAYNWFWNNPSSSSTPETTPIPGYSGFPTFSIKSVVMNQSVTILTKNLPPDDTFTVTMGKMGTLGVGGIAVTSTNSGSGGSIELTYSIPAELNNLSQIAIRIQSPTTGFFAYNWFWNTTANVPRQQLQLRHLHLHQRHHRPQHLPLWETADFPRSQSQPLLEIARCPYQGLISQPMTSLLS